MVPIRFPEDVQKTEIGIWECDLSCNQQGEFSEGFVFRKQNLEIVRDDNPLYHANICGWDGEKAAQLSKAQQMAAESTLVLIPPSDPPANT